jgi:hypothetical protein
MIALEVFGLVSVVWNADSRYVSPPPVIEPIDYCANVSPLSYNYSDWSMQSGTPKSTIVQTISDYLTGDKSNGLIFLEHELNQDDVDMFIQMYPSMISNGWKLANIVSLVIVFQA